jgi:hypothetical protein
MSSSTCVTRPYTHGPTDLASRRCLNHHGAPRSLRPSRRCLRLRVSCTCAHTSVNAEDFAIVEDSTSTLDFDEELCRSSIRDPFTAGGSYVEISSTSANKRTNGSYYLSSFSYVYLVTWSRDVTSLCTCTDWAESVLLLLPNKAQLRSTSSSFSSFRTTSSSGRDGICAPGVRDSILVIPEVLHRLLPGPGLETADSTLWKQERGNRGVIFYSYVSTIACLMVICSVLIHRAISVRLQRLACSSITCVRSTLSLVIPGQLLRSHLSVVILYAL